MEVDADGTPARPLVPLWVAAVRLVVGLGLIGASLVLLMMTPMVANGDPWAAVPYAFLAGPVTGLGAWSVAFTQPRSRLPWFLVGGTAVALLLVVLFRGSF